MLGVRVGPFLRLYTMPSLVLNQRPQRVIHVAIDRSQSAVVDPDRSNIFGRYEALVKSRTIQIPSGEHDLDHERQ